MEELKQAFYEVMCKYEKSFGETGVMANLNAWARNKASLLELLRRHPQWDEDAKAIVFTFDEGRGIEHDVVDEVAFTMEDLAAEQIKDEQQLEDFRISLRTAVSEYSSTLSEQALEIIRNRGGIKCAAGQKTSRIIGKLCRQFGVDGHERYNAVFAQLSDALNPLQMLKTALLSLHPCDFLEMSNKDNTWTSCHNLETGGYQAGALSYMTDDVSMIFFTVDPGVTHHFYRLPRRSRQMFFYKDGSLFQSRLYPSDLSEPMDLYRGIVQKAIATCLGVPNRWILKKKRGQTVSMHNARYIEGAYHCNACLHICAVCGEMIHETMYPAYDRRGRLVEICEGCYQQSLEPCAACSVRSICRIIGNSLCPRTSVAVAEGGAR